MLKSEKTSLLEKIFELCGDSFIYLDLSIQLFLKKRKIAKFYFDGRESRIELKLNSKVIKEIEKSFLVKIDKIPFYCLWYVSIDEILGENFRNAKRKGCIIKEYTENDNEEVEKFCF